MAIAFARVSIHSRSKGHSAVAAASYRAGVELWDSRTGLQYDFSNRHDVVFSEILLPVGSHEAFLNREYLWNQVEAVERRCDAQLCKDVVLALPKELSLVQQIELAKRFAQVHFVEKGLPADISIHDHGDGNPHAHILIPTRRLEQDRFSHLKARDFNPGFAKGHVVEQDYWAEGWREMQNEFFVEKGLDLSVDLNHVVAEKHRGKFRDKAQHYLLDEHELVKEARKEILLSNPENLINHLSLLHSVFTRRDIEKLVLKTFKGDERPEDFLYLVEQVLNHADVIQLGENDRGQVCYTSRQQYLQEARLRDEVEVMMGNYSHCHQGSIEGFSKLYGLSEEQHQAFEFITQGPNISLVVGRPGTGKSYLLKPVKDYYQSHQSEVLGAALSGKVAKSLEADTGIQSSTIASLAYRLGNGQLKLTEKHVLVIDEAGMVDFANMSLLIHEAKKAGSKVIMVGDPDQLKPIFKGEIFRGIAAYTGYIELESIKRQNDLADRQASLDLAKGEVGRALEHYQSKGAVCFEENRDLAIEAMVYDWQQDVNKENLNDSILLSFSRAAVKQLNTQARQCLQDRGIVAKDEHEFEGFEGHVQIAVGDRLLFRQNDRSLGVRNGDLATVKAVNQEGFEVRLDSGETLNIPKQYRAFDYGYALTVHKSQGMTVERASVLVDSKYWDRNLSFVAMTRHKQALKLYADRANHSSLEALKRTMSRSTTRDNVIDWPLDFAIRAGFNPDSMMGRVVNHLAGVGHLIKQAFNYVVNYEGYLVGEQCSRLKDYSSISNKARELACLKDKSTKDPSLGIKMGLDDEVKKYSEQIPELIHLRQMISERTRQSGYFAEKKDQLIRETANLILKKHKPELEKTLGRDLFIKIQKIRDLHINRDKHIER